MIHKRIFKLGVAMIASIYLSGVYATAIPLSSCKLDVISKQNAREWLSATKNIDNFEFNGITHLHNNSYPCTFSSTQDFTRWLTISKDGLLIGHIDLGISQFNRIKDKCVLVKNDKATSKAEVGIRTEMCNTFLAAAGVPANFTEVTDDAKDKGTNSAINPKPSVL